MKRKLILLALVLFSAFANAQFPLLQYIGSDSTMVRSRGGLQGRFAPIPFTDTAQANTSRIRQYPGALIYTSGVDKYWYRNGSVTGWIEFTSSGGATTNIYNSDGTLTGARILSGGNNSLTFDELVGFDISSTTGAIQFNYFKLDGKNSIVSISDTIHLNPNLGNLFIDTLSSDDDTTTYKPLGYDPVTGKVVTRSSWVGGGGGTPTLQEVLATESNIAIIDNTDILPSTSGLDLVFGDAGSTLWNDIVLKGDGTVQMESQTSTNSKSSLFGATPDSVQINAYLGQINIDSLRSWAGTTISDTAYKKVMTWDTRNGRVEYSNWLGAGGGGSGTVTSVGTGYGLSGGTITTSGTLLLDSATVANYFMRRKDSLTTSNALGYVTKTTLADTAAALRSLTSYITIDKRYDSLAWRRNDSTFLIKSLRVQAYGTTQTPTLTDSSFSVNITTAPPTKQSVTSTSDTLHLVNDSTTLTNTKVYGYASGTRGWKDAINVTLTSPTNLQTLVYSSGTFINANKVDTIYRTAGKDSIIYLMSGVRYAIKDSTGGGGGGSAAGNYGNVQLNRNGTFATPASDSLNFTAGSGLNVIGKYLIGGTQAVHIPSSLTATSIFGSGGTSLSHASGNQGYYNTLVGVAAGGAMTTGYMNVGVGWSALGNATMTGWENTAIGTGAMYSATSAQQNVAIGKYSLFSATTAVNNISIGIEALYTNNGNHNIGIGHSAGRGNSSGAENLYMGYFTGYYNQTGSFNTYLGSQAGIGVAANSNANNVGIGYKSMTAVTTGSNNISIGYQAGDALTSGTKNIIIGYDIDAASNTGSNQLTIGNAIFGTGLTGSGTTAAGKVGILNNAPDSTFDVTGGMKTSGGVRFTGLPNGGTSSDSLLVATSTGQVKKLNPNIFAQANTESSYTPSLTNTTNIAASTAYETYYIRMGNTIHVWGTVDIDATTASTVCEMGFSLPVSTSITQIYDVAGTASFEDNTSVQIKADVGNTRAVWRFTPQTNTNNKYSFHFTYKYTAP